jgi:hypothetical protein
MKLEPITPADYPKYKKYFFNQRYDLCGYSLASIIAWSNDYYGPGGCVIDDALIVSADYHNRPELNHLLLPICPEREFLPAELHAIARKYDYGQFWFVPQQYLDRHGNQEIAKYFDIERHAELDDYIYMVEDLAGLKGNRYSKKRNLINQFTRKYVDTDRCRIAEITPQDVDECVDFIDLWCKEQSCDNDQDEDLACERQAAINTLENLEQLEVRGLLLRIDGRVSAFGVVDVLTTDMAVLQYEKALSDIKGLYQYFDNQCAKRLMNGYIYINKESDMGVPGLAKAKKSYLPVKMVHSYKLMVK